MKRVWFLTTILSTAAFADPRPDEDNLELCTTEACAIPVKAKEINGTLYLVKSIEDYQTLSAQWTGASFFVATESDYETFKAGRDTFVLPMIMRAKGGSSGPLVTGSVNVNVNVGGGSSCAECHKGSWKEIHSGVLLPKKPDKGN